MAIGTITGAPGWHLHLYTVGHQYTVELGDWMAQIDPRGRVRLGSRYLCTSLSQLARTCYRSLGGSRQLHQVGRAAAMLSLLTKIDDQVIDARSFHRKTGSFLTIQSKVRHFLTPTLRSLVTGKAATSAPRCRFAAQLGRELQQLAGDPSRLHRLHQWIAWGWEVQARAVATLSSAPSQVSAHQVAMISAHISGVWLLMITMVGTLPADAARQLTPTEESAYIHWGRTIQATDALTDLEKDIHDGLCATVPGMVLWEHSRERYTQACANLDIPAIYAMVCETQADLHCLPTTRQQDALTKDLQSLPQLASLLRWIQGFLLWRYLQHPHCQRKETHPACAALLNDAADWQAYMAFLSSSTPVERH